MKVLFSIGPVHVYFFGLMIATGIIAGVWFAVKTAKKKQINEDTILNLAITVVTAGVIGARVFYFYFIILPIT